MTPIEAFYAYSYQRDLQVLYRGLACMQPRDTVLKRQYYAKEHAAKAAADALVPQLVAALS